MRRIICILLVLALLLSLTACSTEDLEEALRDYIRDAASEAVDNAVGDVQEGLNQKKDELLEKGGELAGAVGTVEGEQPRYDAKETVPCDHSKPAKYDEDDTRGYILCRCGEEPFEGLDFETFLEFLPDYGILDMVKYKSKETYELTKYAYYLGKDVSELTGVSREQQILHYDANGGYLAPEDQFFKKGSAPKLSDVKPRKNGCHFAGWSLEQKPVIKMLPENAPGKISAETEFATLDNKLFFAGNPAENSDGESILEDATLYAVWILDEESRDYECTLVNHKFSLDTSNASHGVILLQCSCGMQVTDMDISQPHFEKYLDQCGNIGKISRGDLYKLYKAQDAGPVAMYFNTEFFTYYDNKDAVRKLLNNAFDIVGSVTTTTKNVQIIMNGLAAVCGSDSDWEQMVSSQLFQGVKKGTKNTALAVKLLKISTRSIQMVTDDNMYQSTKDMLGAVEATVGFLKAGKCARSVWDVLKSGIDLMQKCEAKRKEYYDTLDQTLIDGTPKNTMYVSGLFGSELADRLSECWNNDDGPLITAGPSVYETLQYMKEAEQSQPSPDNEVYQLFFAYLAERSRYELKAASELSLKEYTNLLQKYFK